MVNVLAHFRLSWLKKDIDLLFSFFLFFLGFFWTIEDCFIFIYSSQNTIILIVYYTLIALKLSFFSYYTNDFKS